MFNPRQIHYIYTCDENAGGLEFLTVLEWFRKFKKVPNSHTIHMNRYLMKLGVILLSVVCRAHVHKILKSSNSLDST